MAEIPELGLRPNHQAFVNRFVEACREDDWIVAAFLGGSNVKGYAFYQELAPALTEQHGMKYPRGLERVMMDRLQKLEEAGQRKISLTNR